MIIRVPCGEEEPFIQPACTDDCANQTLLGLLSGGTRCYQFLGPGLQLGGFSSGKAWYSKDKLDLLVSRLGQK